MCACVASPLQFPEMIFEYPGVFDADDCSLVIMLLIGTSWNLIVAFILLRVCLI